MAYEGNGLHEQCAGTGGAFGCMQAAPHAAMGAPDGVVVYWRR